MNTAEGNQQLILFNAKKETFEINIEDNGLASLGRFLRGGGSNKNPFKLIRFGKLKKA